MTKPYTIKAEIETNMVAWNDDEQAIKEFKKQLGNSPYTIYIKKIQVELNK